MIATLIRLRLATWRRTPNGMRGLGITLGAILALGTLAVGAGDLGGPGSSGDLLALVFAAWLLGWVMGPIQTGGGDLLRPEWFAMLPTPPRRLAVGLLAASAVGIGPAVTVAVLAGLVVYGARVAPGAAATAVVAVVLLLAVMVLASKVVAEALGGAARSRIATEVTAAQYGLFVAAMMVGWVAVSALLEDAGALGEEFSEVLPDAAAVAIRAFPPGWGVVAVEAAGRGDWPLVLLALAGLAALVWLGLALWSSMLRQRLTGGRSGTASRPHHSRRQVLPATAVGAVAGKDLKTWLRDPRRGVEVRGALWAAAFTTAALWAMVPDVLPFAGVAVAVIGAMTCVNVYAMDGTALWLTLLTPGAERADVRGRQVAWLLIFAPAAVLPTVAGLIVSGATWAVPWVAALLPALLGGAAGLIPLLSVYGLAPETDAHKRTGNPAETGSDATGLYFVMLFATLLTALPAAAVLALGLTAEGPAASWAAVLVGAGSGAAYAWGFGWLAVRRLRSHGPELLQLMRAGRPVATAPAVAADAQPRLRQALLGTCVTLGMIALFPQAVVPAVFKLTGQVEPVWFLALHAPPAWQWPIIAAMTLAAAGLLTAAYALSRHPRR